MWVSCLCPDLLPTLQRALTTGQTASLLRWVVASGKSLRLSELQFSPLSKEGGTRETVSTLTTHAGINTVHRAIVLGRRLKEMWATHSTSIVGNTQVKFVEIEIFENK